MQYLKKLDDSVRYEDNTFGIFDGKVLIFKSTDESIPGACRKCYFGNGIGLDGCMGRLGQGVLRCMGPDPCLNYYWHEPEQYCYTKDYPTGTVVAIGDKLYIIKALKREPERKNCDSCERGLNVSFCWCNLKDCQVFEELMLKPDVHRVIDLRTRELTKK